MKTFLKDLVSNQALLITAFFSATTLLLSLMQFFRDILNSRRQDQLEKTKLNYTYKLNCYSELMAMFAEKSSTIYSDKSTSFQFRLLLLKARLLSSNGTKSKITDVLKFHTESNNEDFRIAVQDLLLAMENEMECSNKNSNSLKNAIILGVVVAILSNFDRIVKILF